MFSCIPLPLLCIAALGQDIVGHHTSFPLQAINALITAHASGAVPSVRLVVLAMHGSKASHKPLKLHPRVRIDAVAAVFCTFQCVFNTACNGCYLFHASVGCRRIDPKFCRSQCVFIMQNEQRYLENK